ncbi:MAG: glycosyltransferase family 4 protein [Alphaproteobacteria bacterium]|nr:glycosyltransferase family 4 protein [Alphaproteobacteria bacterium]
MAKLIDAMNADPDIELRVIWACKDYNSKWLQPRAIVARLSRLKNSVLILPGKASIPFWLGRAREKLRECLHLYWIYKQACAFKPDLIYFDRVNIFPAAIFARYSRFPVVWRVMGVIEGMHQHANSPKIRSVISRWLYRSPFKAVICTRDGSNGQSWMNKVLGPYTSKHYLLNGFDRAQEASELPIDIPQHKTIILFAGRLEHIKGLNELVHVCELLRDSRCNSIHVLVAGYGSAESWIREEIKKRKLDEFFTFAGALTPSQMRKARSISDIYLSMNTHGNLTNTVIEALCDGLCTIIPTSNHETGIDQDTDVFIPDDVVLRYGLQNDTVGLAKLLLELLSNPNQIEYYKKSASNFSLSHIPSWKERVEMEISILRSIAQSSI